MHKLIAHNVSKRFRSASADTYILSNVNIVFDQGMSYAIMGVSGVGKSSFMHLLAGLELPTHGTILFDDQNIALHGEESRRIFLQKNIGLLFQSPYLIRELSVLENVMLPGFICGAEESILRERALYLLHRVGLQEKKDMAPRTLSVGQQQRVALCRALCNDPSFLLADEPTGALDEKTAEEIKVLLLELKSQLNMGLIISTHDRQLAYEMDRVYEIEDGNLVEKKKNTTTIPLES